MPMHSSACLDALLNLSKDNIKLTLTDPEAAVPDGLLGLLDFGRFVILLYIFRLQFYRYLWLGCVYIALVRSKNDVSINE